MKKNDPKANVHPTPMINTLENQPLHSPLLHLSLDSGLGHLQNALHRKRYPYRSLSRVSTISLMTLLEKDGMQQIWISTQVKDYNWYVTHIEGWYHHCVYTILYAQMVWWSLYLLLTIICATCVAMQILKGYG